MPTPQLLGTFPPNATYVNGHTITNFPANLISQARAAGAGFDIAAVRSMTALLKKFNSSGLTNDLPNGLVECSAQSGKILKPISRDPTTQEPLSRVNNTCLSAKTIVFSGPTPVFKDSVSIVNFPNNMPVPSWWHRRSKCCVAGEPAGSRCRAAVSVSTSGSNFDTLLAVWVGHLQHLTEVGCADNVPGIGGETLTFYHGWS